MLVNFKESRDESVSCAGSPTANGLRRALSYADMLPLVVYPKRTWTQWTTGYLPGRILSRVERAKPDLLHLHWVGRGFVPIRALRHFRVPVVWTMHDMWPFTGGCHYAGDCRRYVEDCGVCPQLASPTERDLSRWVWRSKRTHWEGVPFILASPSPWLAQCARESSLFRHRRIEVIPNGLDTDVFSPAGRPSSRALILAGAVNTTRDQRKGFRLLQAALHTLAADGWRGKAELVVFGSDEPPGRPDVGVPTTYLGGINDDRRLVSVYSKASVFVAPSIQENLANTVMEAAACGTPCVAFDIGGMSAMIEHRRTGYLATPFEADDLARGISWVIENGERRVMLSTNARAKVEAEFEIETIARRYAQLYEELLAA